MPRATKRCRREGVTEDGADRRIRLFPSAGVDASEQGRLQGAVAGLTALAGLFGPWTFTHLYATGIDPAPGWNLPGVAFYAAALALAVAFLVVLRLRRSAAGS